MEEILIESGNTSAYTFRTIICFVRVHDSHSAFYFCSGMLVDEVEMEFISLEQRYVSLIISPISLQPVVCLPSFFSKNYSCEVVRSAVGLRGPKPGLGTLGIFILLLENVNKGIRFYVGR